MKINKDVACDPYNKDIKAWAEYNGRMAANMLDSQHMNYQKIKSLVHASFLLGASFQRNIIDNKPNIID